MNKQYDKEIKIFFLFELKVSHNAIKFRNINSTFVYEKMDRYM